MATPIINPKVKEEKTLGTKEVAAKLKVEPRYLRGVLRATRGKAPGVQYEFTENDIQKLKKMIDDYEAKKKGAAEKRAAAEGKKPATEKK